MQPSSPWSQFKLPLLILGYFLLAAAWVAFGRLFFGVFGWMIFILLFTILPVIVIYGIVLAAIVAFRQRNGEYKKNGKFMIGLYITLFLLFVIGLTIPDGGDTPGSAGSALTVLMGNKSDDGLIGLSGALAGWSIFAAFISSIATIVVAFLKSSMYKKQ